MDRHRWADEALRPYCNTQTQRVYLDKLIELGSITGVARALEKDHKTIRQALGFVAKRAASQGYSPEHDMNRTVPDGYHVKGTSTLYDEDGKPRLQWVKSSIDHEKQKQLMEEAVKALCEDITPVSAISPPSNTVEDLCNCYITTDYHLGALAWGEETGGDDWDTDIAEDLLTRWYGAAIAQAPDAHTAVLAQLGDFLHWDGLDAVTPTSKHVLDADTRFARLVRVAIRLIRRIISMLLEKHAEVIVIMAEGNHDIASSVWLRELFSALYDQEPRITVDQSPDPYYCFEWGLTSLFFHHGHKRRPANVDHVFAAKFREVFGRTKYSYGHMGHLHHLDAKETNLMTIIQHPTLASPDSHASRGGWMSKRSADVTTYSKEHGEVGKITIRPEMVGAA